MELGAWCHTAAAWVLFRMSEGPGDCYAQPRNQRQHLKNIEEIPPRLALKKWFVVLLKFHLGSLGEIECVQPRER